MTPLLLACCHALALPYHALPARPAMRPSVSVDRMRDEQADTKSSSYGSTIIFPCRPERISFFFLLLICFHAPLF
ncbi:hypothetical protein F4778DRAFT_48294 [Xylariomycetidae sp. FL2044]|nr:hypothetical protein F4778DRAFT_48294 [Xylariomycetidae sp. FL2044]